ncbi:MAG: hypothetical protein A2660_00025 [Candidatus Doudnabacteria bacterium RIFCSPHIGHO2_01_FULL_45_18]|uniref:Uncharacterized protein n=1 Tax=Candidatus Doudnabacteria bacterium RIFCSPHIGHO2_01_FULL_45_18 TaxID=1817823 RepID=A0A1F5NRE1_9BACT|nr:MAG: hypothetical protein A2660_00025 [Candidatus Doudnabacteria bacterium RIFCSPHIGHO2_01_FULL_45_18]
MVLQDHFLFLQFWGFILIQQGNQHLPSKQSDKTQNCGGKSLPKVSRRRKVMNKQGLPDDADRWLNTTMITWIIMIVIGGIAVAVYRLVR